MTNSNNKVAIVTGAGSGHMALHPVALSLTHKAEPRTVRLRKREFYQFLIT